MRPGSCGSLKAASKTFSTDPLWIALLSLAEPLIGSTPIIEPNINNKFEDEEIIEEEEENIQPSEFETIEPKNIVETLQEIEDMYHKIYFNYRPKSIEICSDTDTTDIDNTKNFLKYIKSYQKTR